MGYIASGDVVNQAPPVFCAYMEVLAALAADAGGAQVRDPGEGPEVLDRMPLFCEPGTATPVCSPPLDRFLRTPGQAALVRL